MKKCTKSKRKSNLKDKRIIYKVGSSWIKGDPNNKHFRCLCKREQGLSWSYKYLQLIMWFHALNYVTKSYDLLEVLFKLFEFFCLKAQTFDNLSSVYYIITLVLSVYICNVS